MEYCAKAGDKILDVETGEVLATAARDISLREFLQPDMFKDTVVPLVGNSEATRKLRASLARALLVKTPNRIDRQRRKGELDG